MTVKGMELLDGGQSPRDRNKKTGLMLALLVGAMVGLAFASVPLYQLFCQVTGYGGTPQVSENAAEGVLDRPMKIRFDSAVNSDLPWTFKPAQRQVEFKVGETALAFYRARNDSDKTIKGMATFNVTPLKAGPYFVKMECFCFTEQTLHPGEEVDMPVTFYVDPAIADDPNLDEIETITLSYTFFREEGEEEVSMNNLEGGQPLLQQLSTN